IFFFSSRRRHTRSYGDWSSDVCSSDLIRSCAQDASEQTGVRRERSTKIGDPEYKREIEKQAVAADRAVEQRAGAHNARHDRSARSEERRVGKEWRARGGGAPAE